MMDSGAILAVFMRWLHITSVVTLIGGFIYARFVVWPAVESLGQAQGRAFIENMVAQTRAVLYTVLVTTLVSGLYNYLTKPAYPPHYHMVIGIKFLFVMHVFAVAVLYTLPNADPAKRRRWLTGMVVSGIIIIAISADLRWLSLNALMH
jgi:uncharacterized membrane protein